jgi:hypothetical protein
VVVGSGAEEAGEEEGLEDLAAVVLVEAADLAAAERAVAGKFYLMLGGLR